MRRAVSILGCRGSNPAGRNLSRFDPGGVLIGDWRRPHVEFPNDLVLRAKRGDLEAYSRLVKATQTMAFAVAAGVLRDSSLAEDAAQEAYLKAFRRLRDLEDPAAFTGWLRRIVITVALNMRRARRVTFLQLEDVPMCRYGRGGARWSELQRHTLGRCDPRSKSAASAIAAHANGYGPTGAGPEIDETAMRKRLNAFAKSCEGDGVSEQQRIGPGDIRRIPAR